MRSRKRKINETLSDMAGKVDQDHEVDLARSDLYQIADHAIKLHDMLKTVSEEQGIDASVQSKITKAVTYMDEVYHELSYDLHPDDMDIGSELGIDDIEDDSQINDMDQLEDEFDDIENPAPMVKPARSIESRRYHNKKPIKESRNSFHKPRVLREINSYTQSLDKILNDGFSKIEMSEKKKR